MRLPMMTGHFRKPEGTDNRTPGEHYAGSFSRAMVACECCGHEWEGVRRTNGLPESGR